MIGIAFCLFALLLQLQGNEDAAWALGVIGIVITCIEKILAVFDQNRARTNRRS